ncbi:hypothetical protein JCM11641_001878 [Rhodosporidiobolus odoratus]
MPDAMPTWQRDLDETGFAVVNGAVPAAKAAAYVEAAKRWAERFGWKEDDRSTWTDKALPGLPVSFNGLCNEYGVAHERFVWEARTEEKVVEVFEELWGTKELLVSFDAINFSPPVGPHGRTDIEPAKPWPHIDQQPTPADRPALQFELAQGLLAMSESGPDDGGLVVLKNSHKLVKRFFDETGGPKEAQDSGHRNYYEFTEEDIKWFRQQPAVEEIKVETQPGDLVVWDSRTAHWNKTPVGTRTRVVVYVCYAPKSFASQEVLQTKKECWEKRLATTHWPAPFVVVPRDEYGAPQRNGEACPLVRDRPFEEPEVTDRLLQLVGY